MGTKYEVVSDWLATVYEGRGVPAFEINERTIDLLYTLATENTVRNRQIEIMAKDAEAMADEYRSENIRLNEQLEAIGITADDLSQSGSSSVTSLTEIALALKLRDLSTSTYFAAISDLTQALATVSNEQDDAKRLSEGLLEETRAIIRKANQLKSFLEQLEFSKDKLSDVVETKRQSIDYLESKGRQYAVTEANLKELIARSGVSADLTHRALSQQHQRLQEVRARIGPVQKQLDQFRDLPPDMALATLKIEEAKNKLQALEDSVVNNLGQGHPGDSVFVTQ